MRLIILIFLLKIALAHNITISGLSSGGFFAVQFQLAHSSMVSGTAVLAGGPYWCAQDNVAIALTSCMNDSSLINVQELVSATYYAASLFSIDDPANLKNHRIWVYSGSVDSVVEPGVVHKLVEYYIAMGVPEGSIQSEFAIKSEHAFPTLDYGNTCSELASPYISRCEYDAAGIMLQHLYVERLNPRGVANVTSLQKFDQRHYVPLHVDPKWCGLGDNGYVYIPESCINASQCRLHVAFHGCLQTDTLIGDAFYGHTGLNDWAETNDIIVLYPQADSNVLNPKSCWDWWGYTGPQYATRAACQIMAVESMVNHFSISASLS